MSVRPTAFEVVKKFLGLDNCCFNLLFMANSYHQVYLQAVFAVKYRKALLAKEWRDDIFNIIGNLVNETGCQSLIVNGIEDHVHCLFGLRPSVSISNVMQNIKAKSSKHINETALTLERFEWQEGYGVFSYSRSHIDKVYCYIQNQKAHHAKQSFLDEYTSMLNKYEIAYDERYLFSELI